MDLVKFLTARLDEVERIAKLAAREGGIWKQDDPERFPGAISSLGGPVVYDEGAPDENQAAHIALHDPARVLREVEAGRKILAEYRAVLKLMDLTGADRSALRYREWTIRALAAAYSDHADYDPDRAL